MAEVIHTLVKYEYQPGNRAGLQHYVECSCGFQGRLGTEEAAKSQFDAHLMYHGTQPYFSKLAAAEAAKAQPNAWIPTGAKPPLGPTAPHAPAHVGASVNAPIKRDWKPVGAK